MEVKWSTEGQGGHWVGLHGGLSREAQCEGISQPALGAGETGNRKRHLLSLENTFSFFGIRPLQALAKSSRVALLVGLQLSPTEAPHPSSPRPSLLSHQTTETVKHKKTVPLAPLKRVGAH